MTSIVGRARTVLAVADIISERRRQRELWGEQHHPDGTGGKFTFVGWSYDGLAQAMKHHNDDPNFELTWTGILLEEVFEALAEKDEVKLRGELVQAAAVITAWIEDIDSED